MNLVKLLGRRRDRQREVVGGSRDMRPGLKVAIRQNYLGEMANCVTNYLSLSVHYQTDQLDQLVILRAWNIGQYNSEKKVIVCG